MAYELNGVLSSAVSLNTGKKVVPAYGGQNESFLRNVVTPIYKVIHEVIYVTLYFTFFIATVFV